MGPTLRADYEMCRRLHRRHDPTYYWATRRLPGDVRPATHALYGYVRVADDLVDGPRRASDPAARRAALDAWEAELTVGSASPSPVVRALADAAGRHDLRLGELQKYMHSMRIDCGTVRIGTHDELDEYMDGSAGSVGRIMAPLLGVPERHRADFGQLGRAFQLTNFLRDVEVDWSLDRVYLPGVGEEDLAAGSASPGLRARVREEVVRARAMFAACEPAIAAAPRAVRPGIRMACAVYQRVLDRIERSGYDVLGGRTRPLPLDYVVAAGRGVRG